MMDPVPCPCCKAVNPAGPHCRRCKADLTLLFAVAEEQARLLAAAHACLRRGDPTAATAILDKAESLRATPTVGRLRAVAALLSRDFAAAVGRGR